MIIGEKLKELCKVAAKVAEDSGISSVRVIFYKMDKKVC